MFKAGSHILDKVKRVSGRRVIVRTGADIKVQRGAGPPGSTARHCFLPAAKPLHNPTRRLPPPAPSRTELRDDEKTI